MLLIIHCLLLLITSLVHQNINADFSLKGFTSWMTGTKEATSFKEYPLEDNCTVIIENNVGTILIKSWSLPKIAIEAVKAAPEKDLNTIEINTLVFPHQISISTMAPKNGSVDYQLIVPTHTNIVVKIQNGSVKIKNVEGVIQVSAENGSIDIQGAINSVHALASGSINISFSSLPLQSCIYLKSLKKNVTITLPSISHALIKANTIYNTIISEHFITLKPITITLNKQAWENFKKQINGTIGNGGATLDIFAYNGINLLQH